MHAPFLAGWALQSRARSIFLIALCLCLVAVSAVVVGALPLMIALERMDQGDLKSYLRACRPTVERPRERLDVDALLRIALSITRACEFMEERRLVHRGLMCRNVLVGDAKASDGGGGSSGDGGGGGGGGSSGGGGDAAEGHVLREGCNVKKLCFKLADFGMSRSLKDSATSDSYYNARDGP